MIIPKFFILFMAFNCFQPSETLVLKRTSKIIYIKKNYDSVIQIPDPCHDLVIQIPRSYYDSVIQIPNPYSDSVIQIPDPCHDSVIQIPNPCYDSVVQEAVSRGLCRHASTCERVFCIFMAIEEMEDLPQSKIDSLHVSAPADTTVGCVCMCVMTYL